jgi:hypothetical protein
MVLGAFPPRPPPAAPRTAQTCRSARQPSRPSSAPEEEEEEEEEDGPDCVLEPELEEPAEDGAPVVVGAGVVVAEPVLAGDVRVFAARVSVLALPLCDFFVEAFLCAGRVRCRVGPGF